MLSRTVRFLACLIVATLSVPAASMTESRFLSYIGSYIKQNPKKTAFVGCALGVASWAVYDWWYSQKPVTGNNLCRYLFNTEEDGYRSPASLEQLREILEQATKENKKICIVGAGKSQGGQTCSGDNTIRVSLNKLNALISLDVTNKTMSVQAGMTWRQLQAIIAPHRLAVKVMQSYNDFSIGGSLGVNVHGQDIFAGALINTVKSFTLMLDSGKTIKITPYNEHRELFDLVIGGYGLFGVVTDVTFLLTDDALMNKEVVCIEAGDLADYFRSNIQNNKVIQFYSARFSVGPRDLLDKAMIITYKTSDEQPANSPLWTLKESSESSFLRNLFYLMKKFPAIKNVRFSLEKRFFENNETVSRNNHTNQTINSLPKNDASSQYILQEYFIPYDNLNAFLLYLKKSILDFKINILNITARHVPQDSQTVLNFARTDCCALVLYIGLEKKDSEYTTIRDWTHGVIDHALSCHGTYYLPYQLLAKRSQFQKAYPRWQWFLDKKNKWDSKLMFTNQLYEKYFA